MATPTSIAAALRAELAAIAADPKRADAPFADARLVQSMPDSRHPAERDAIARYDAATRRIADVLKTKPLGTSAVMDTGNLFLSPVVGQGGSACRLVISAEGTPEPAPVDAFEGLGASDIDILSEAAEQWAQSPVFGVVRFEDEIAAACESVDDAFFAAAP